MDQKIASIGEFGLIEKITKGLTVDKSVITGAGDDCAVLKFNKHKYLLLTTDILVDGVHFVLRNTPPFKIGWKALAVNISDIAAMGGAPRAALVCLGLPRSCSVRTVEGIYQGLRKIARRFGINIVGGDTSRADKLMINISLLGEVKKKNLVLRNGAKQGDLIFVTGSLGGSIHKKHLTFIPRLKESQILVEKFKLHAMIDLSDGLSSDLNHILRASGVGAIVYEELLPLSPEAKSVKEALIMGEDFELLFTLPLKKAQEILRAKPRGIRIPITQIGEIKNKKFALSLITKKGRIRKLKPEGFKHF